MAERQWTKRQTIIFKAKHQKLKKGYTKYIRHSHMCIYIVYIVFPFHIYFVVNPESKTWILQFDDHYHVLSNGSNNETNLGNIVLNTEHFVFGWFMTARPPIKRRLQFKLNGVYFFCVLYFIMKGHE